MLTYFGLTNFKAFGPRQCFGMGPITLIYGPNSGGKSSIIQALLLLKQSIEAPINRGLRDRVLVPKGLYADLGQSKSIHHKHLFSNQIAFDVGLKPPKGLSRGFGPILRDGDEFSTTLTFEHREDSIRSRLPALAEINYSLGRSSRNPLNLTLVRGVKSSRKPIDEQLELEEIESHRNSFNFFNFSSFEQIRHFNEFLSKVPLLRAEEMRRDFFDIEGIKEEKEKNRFQVGFRPSFAGKTTYLPSTVRKLSKSDPRREDGSLGILDVPTRTLSTVARLFNTQFEAMSYLGPLRSRPRRLYELSQQYQGSIGLSGEYAVEALKMDLLADRHGGESVIDFVNRWLKKFEVPYTVAIDDIGNEVLGDLAMLKLRDNRTGVWVAATDVGFGIGQLLPVIIQGALATRASHMTGHARAICVEQPEIHLHPRLQANVADFLISTAQNEGCQWIIETHSEALMLRIQRRIRDGVLNAKDVSVVFVEPIGESGSRILNLRLDDNGSFIDEWPGGFFEDSFSEMFS